MSLIKYIERVQRMDKLISMMATGPPERFAEKLGIKRSAMFESLQEMRRLGLNVRYSSSRQSYYYADSCRLKIVLEKQVEKEVLKKSSTRE